jgi:circadian clock protein KaiB
MSAAFDANQSPDDFRLRLFVSGATPRSMRAIATVRKLCVRRASPRYSLEVVDIYRNPSAAREHQIVALPTLLKLAPIPKRLFIGDMSDGARLATGLGLAS